MAEEFNPGSGNWWESSSRNRFDNSAGAGSSSSSSALSSSALGSFGWTSEVVDVKARSNSMDSGSSTVFQDKLHDSSAADQQHHLHMMGLGLSSQPSIDWNQSLLRGDKAESSFRSMLQENLNANASASYQQEAGTINIGCTSSSSSSSSSQVQWRDNEFRQINNRGFFIEQSQFSPHGSSSDSTVTCQGLPSTNTNFPMDNSPNSNLYANPSSIYQGFLGSDHQNNQPQQSRLSYNQYGATSNYGMSPNNELLPPTASWPRSPVPQFLRASPPRPHSQLQFSNNAPFWNPSANMTTDVRPTFFPTLQSQLHTSNFDEKPRNISEVRDTSSVVKKAGNDQPAPKRVRNETASPSPAFKVRKEKMGDRIAALQQLVSPFGKTDAASVLSEAIEYIKFLHEQVTVLSTPYMKTGAPLQHQQGCENPKDPDGPKQDLRSRGLCLVPVSSTFPVTHETTVDFWTPTFGGTFR